MRETKIGQDSTTDFAVGTAHQVGLTGGSSLPCNHGGQFTNLHLLANPVLSEFENSL